MIHALHGEMIVDTYRILNILPRRKAGRTLTRHRSNVNLRNILNNDNNKVRIV